MNEAVLKRRLLAGAGALALAAGMASAAHAAPPPPPAPMYNWSGFYIGAHGGYGWGRDPFTDTLFGGKTVSNVDSKGWLGGFQAGANWQSGSWVGGVEIDLSATGIKGANSTTVVSQFVSNNPPGLATETDGLGVADKFDLLGSARARLGYLPLPNLLLYGTAGPAWTQFVQTFSISASATVHGFTESFLENDSGTSWRFGAVVGVGAETKLWDSNWLARLEYLHYDFGRSDGQTGVDIFENAISGRLTADVVRAGLSYQFAQAPGMGSYASAAKLAMPVKAPVALPWSWSGFYIGAHAGYGWAHDPFSDPNQGFDNNITITDIDSNGFVGGLQAGGNWQMGSYVGGVEFDLSGAGIKGSTSVTVPFTGGITGTDTVSQSDSFDLLATARVRLGYLATPDVLVYGTGGLAFTHVDAGFQEIANFTSGGFTSFVDTSDVVGWRLGWVAGIGVEARLWNTNWLARLEYLHYDFGDSGNSFDNGVVTFSSDHITTDVVRAGLSYKFDWNNPAAAPVRTAMPLKAMPLKAPPMAWSWNGFYVGGHVGYGWGREPKGASDVITGTGFTPPSDPLVLTDVNSSGALAGFQAGANWQLGAFVTGLEIDLSGTGIKGTTTNFSALGDFGESNTNQFDMLGSARARLGYLVLPDVLLYGTGGLAWSRLTQTELDFDNFGNFSSMSNPSWTFGWVAGIGGETRLWNTNWIARLEYLHYDFGNVGSQSAVNTDSFPPVNASEVTTISTGRLTTDVVRTALSFKFN
jgi:outer membrane immunogenic protein